MGYLTKQRKWCSSFFFFEKDQFHVRGHTLYKAVFLAIGPFMAYVIAKVCVLFVHLFPSLMHSQPCHRLLRMDRSGAVHMMDLFLVIL